MCISQGHYVQMGVVGFIKEDFQQAAEGLEEEEEEEEGEKKLQRKRRMR